MEKFKKENVKKEFLEMIKNSWTFNKMTAEEKTKLFETMENVTTAEAVKGNYRTRWTILQSIYSSFLIGLGYNGFNWRSGEENAPNF